MLDDIKKNLKAAYNNYIKINKDSKDNESKPWQIEQRELFLNLLKNEKKQTLIDLGAGIGEDCKFFEDEGFAVTAVDFSEEMLVLCREKELKTLELDLYYLDQLYEQFDAVWAMNSLIHIEKHNFTMVLHNIQKILNPSGLFFMSVYGGEDSEGILENDFFTPARFFSFYTDESLLKIICQHFEIVNFTIIPTSSKYHPQCLILKKITYKKT